MRVAVQRVGAEAEEQVVVYCHEISDDVKSIVSFVRLTGASLTGYLDEKAIPLPLQDIFFVEAVDERVFAYTAKKVYEIKCKLYEFEASYESRKFFRCSKSFILNLMKVDHVQPILNGRFSAKLLNGEEVIISRQYVPELKKRLLGANP